MNARRVRDCGPCARTHAVCTCARHVVVALMQRPVHHGDGAGWMHAPTSCAHKHTAECAHASCTPWARMPCARMPCERTPCARTRARRVNACTAEHSVCTHVFPPCARTHACTRAYGVHARTHAMRTHARDVHARTSCADTFSVTTCSKARNSGFTRGPD
jgi:hypothetical protein